MGHKNQFPIVFNWQATQPVVNPQPANQTGTAPSGTLAGAMASTNTIYSQVIEKSRIDNIFLELTWTGTPTGTFQVMASASGQYFYALTFVPALTQPNGSASGIAINLTQLAAKYIMLQYTNSSGTGSLYVYGQAQDLN